MLRKYLCRVVKLVLFVALALTTVSCEHARRENGLTQSITKDSICVNKGNDSSKCRIFDVEANRDEQSVLRCLEKKGVIKIDSIKVENDKLQFAIIEFAGVKFGANKCFSFITGKHDTATINSLVKEISKYYGTPDVSDEDDEPEYRYYDWNIYSSDYPHIRIRPLHSDEEGLLMMWYI